MALKNMRPMNFPITQRSPLALTDVTPYFAPPEAFALARRMQPIWRARGGIYAFRRLLIR